MVHFLFMFSLRCMCTMLQVPFKPSQLFHRSFHTSYVTMNTNNFHLCSSNFTGIKTFCTQHTYYSVDQHIHMPCPAHDLKLKRLKAYAAYFGCEPGTRILQFNQIACEIYLYHSPTQTYLPRKGRMCGKGLSVSLFLNLSCLLYLQLHLLVCLFQVPYCSQIETTYYCALLTFSGPNLMQFQMLSKAFMWSFMPTLGGVWPMWPWSAFPQVGSWVRR